MARGARGPPSVAGLERRAGIILRQDQALKRLGIAGAMMAALAAAAAALAPPPPAAATAHAPTAPTAPTAPAAPIAPAAPAAASAASPAGELPRGQLIERVSCADQADQGYALYLPGAYR
ncbi:MAG TPA: hypothetical protein VE075_09005, partial [Thermoanaerobaculia bacterium]|nr:hypothetical protein [Thermoanaerobaculia bacterium]